MFDMLIKSFVNFCKPALQNVQYFYDYDSMFLPMRPFRWVFNPDKTRHLLFVVF